MARGLYDLNFCQGQVREYAAFLISLPRHEAERKEEGVRLKSCHQSNIKKMEADSIYTHLCIIPSTGVEVGFMICFYPQNMTKVMDGLL